MHIFKLKSEGNIVKVVFAGENEVDFNSLNRIGLAGSVFLPLTYHAEKRKGVVVYNGAGFSALDSLGKPQRDFRLLKAVLKSFFETVAACGRIGINASGIVADLKHIYTSANGSVAFIYVPYIAPLKKKYGTEAFPEALIKFFGNTGGTVIREAFSIFSSRGCAEAAAYVESSGEAAQSGNTGFAPLSALPVQPVNPAAPQPVQSAPVSGAAPTVQLSPGLSPFNNKVEESYGALPDFTNKPASAAPQPVQSAPVSGDAPTVQLSPDMLNAQPSPNIKDEVPEAVVSDIGTAEDVSRVPVTQQFQRPAGEPLTGASRSNAETTVLTPESSPFNAPPVPVQPAYTPQPEMFSSSSETVLLEDEPEEEPVAPQENNEAQAAQVAQAQAQAAREAQEAQAREAQAQAQAAREAQAAQARAAQAQDDFSGLNDVRGQQMNGYAQPPYMQGAPVNAAPQASAEEPDGYETVLMSDYADDRGAYVIRFANKHISDVHGSVFSIGAGNDMSLSIPGNRRISRHHASIVFEEGKYYIIDNNSTNLTIVDGVVLTPYVKKQLYTGSRIVMADEIFDFFTK